MSLNRIFRYITGKGTRIMVYLLLLSIFSLVRIYADESAPLFLSDEIIKLELRSDFTAIEKGRTEDPVYYAGELIYYSPDAGQEVFSVEIRARGNFRRNPEICEFPPLLVNFKEKEVKNSIFDDQDKLKLVTPCQDEEDVLDEYLVYKMYNLVTDLSFKVRLARIVYYDTGTDRKLFEKYSFFLEDEDEMAKRNDAVAKDRFLTPFDLNRENFRNMAVFEYLIGNKDWHITSRKNVIILEPEDSSLGYLAVPYDFDLSGIIDVPYSKPEGIPDYSLADKRIYKGLCYTDDELNETFEFFSKLKPLFESVIDDQELLPKYDRKKLTRYMNYFYTIIKYDILVNQEFLSSCQTRKDFNLPEL